MDTPERGALMLVRFVAVALIGVSVVNFMLYWLVSSAHHMPLEIFPAVMKFVPAVIGIVILIRARTVAEWLSDKMN